MSISLIVSVNDLLLSCFILIESEVVEKSCYNCIYRVRFLSATKFYSLKWMKTLWELPFRP